MEFIMLLLSSLLLITTRTVGASDAVLDVRGNALQRGQRYFALSISWVGGTLTPTPLKEPCPLYVAPVLHSLPQPLVFLPENNDEDTIVEGSTLYVKFAEPTQCPESTMWMVDTKTGYVVTGGNTSASIGLYFSRFAIRKFHSFYQFQFCPCMECLGSVGLIEEESKNVIGVGSNLTLTVSFFAEEHSLIRSAVMRAN